MTPRERISALQTLMRAHGMDAYIIPTTDPHMSEYVAPRWQARSWVSGFAGSAGTLVVLPETAGLWTDPRYHIRANQELQGSGIELFKLGLPGVPPYPDWLAHNLPPNAVIGFDGSVFAVSDVAKLAHAFQDKPVTMSSEHDLVGQIWTDRPPLPQNEIFIHPLQFAGESRTVKLSNIRRELAAQNANAHLISALDDIAWTLNIRGSDIAFNPVAISYLFISHDAVRLFMDAAKIPHPARAELEQDGIQLSPYTDLLSFITQLPSQTAVLLDPTKTSYRLEQLLSQTCQTIHASNIPARLKAQKNQTEQNGLCAAHVRDGVAVVKWLSWLAEQTFEEPYTEITLGDKLTQFRSAGENFRGSSFGNIVAYQANSAVGHYSANPETTPRIRRDGILLVDSGGQYLDGTTDITRTLTLGNPTPEQKRVFTTVLRSLIRLSETKFPHGTQGRQLDAIAREPLWQSGWNCRHDIGHGIGYFLNVHEGPQRFSETNTVVIEPGMLTSNEPGVYFEGNFGVRLENLVLARSDKVTHFGEFLGFETVTLCPLDLALLDASLLSPSEKNWLNTYHRRVLETLSPFLSAAETAWLSMATREI